MGAANDLTAMDAAASLSVAWRFRVNLSLYHVMKAMVACVLHNISHQTMVACMLHT
jgi:hypothetical protein